MGYIDLHVHTKNSDGVFTPQEIIDKARAMGITTLAITDHNKLLPDYQELQEKNMDIHLIRASEISSSHTFKSGRKVDIHIVGLMLDDTPWFIEFLKNNKGNGKGRIVAILQKLKEECNIDIGSYDDIQKMFPDKSIGRTQLALALLKHGFVTSKSEAFDIYFGDRGKRLAWAENPIEYGSIEEIVSVIKKVHGIAVLAHPLTYGLNKEELGELFDVFVNARGDAMETEYRNYTKEERAALTKVAKERNLLTSCGSDFHGDGIDDRLDHCFEKRHIKEIEALHQKMYSC